MTSSLLRNIVRTFSTQIGTQVFAIVTGIVVARSIGPEGKGFFSYAGMAVTLVSTVMLGFSDAVMYQIARRRIAERTVYDAALRVLFASLVLFVPLFIVIASVVPSQRALAASAATLPFMLYVQFATPFLLFHEQVALTNLRSITQSFGTAALTIPLLLSTHLGLRAVIGAWILFNAVSAVQTFYPLRSIIESSTAAMQPVRTILNDQIRFGTRAAAASISGYLNLRIDVFVVSALLSAKALGWYTLAIASGELLWMVSRAILWPALGRIAADPLPQAAVLVARMTRNSLAIVGSLGIVAFAAGPWLIVHVYGPAFEPAGLALRFALPGLVAYAAETALTHFVMLQLGRPATVTWIQCASTVICAGLAIATVGRFGIVAAAAATSMTYFAVTLCLVTIFMRTTGISLGELFILRPDDFARYGRVVKSALSAIRFGSA